MRSVAVVVRARRYTRTYVRTWSVGRAFRTLNIVDDFTRECLAIEMDRSLPGLRVDAGARPSGGDESARRAAGG